MDEFKAQINVRISPELAQKLDDYRASLLKTMGKIPSRSDLIRMALEEYLKGHKKK